MQKFRMWQFKSWNEAARSPEAVDVSSEAREGYIPVECPGIISPTGRACKAKLRDCAQTLRIKGVIVKRMVMCDICDYAGWRNVARRKK